jgi:DNA (cytosine-5)-methyltransferase 1
MGKPMNQLSLFEEPDLGAVHMAVSQVGPWADRFGEQLQAHAKSSSAIPAISLFSGAGGLDIGFHDVGFDIQHAVEIDKLFSATLSANVGEKMYFGPNAKIHCTDVKEFCASGLAADFIIGGPPCQSFSAAGARAMGVAGTKDERGNLFEEYVRILKQLKPRGFLFENVYRLLGANHGSDWNRISAAFTNAGYVLYHRILDTADYGVAQHRERLIVVGVRNDIADKVNFQFPRPTHGPDSQFKTPYFSAAAAIDGINQGMEAVGLKGRYGHLLNEVPPGLNYSYFTEKMGHPNPIFAWRSKFSDFLYKADPSTPVRTIKAQGGQYTGPFHWMNRPFSETELKRLQSFPDNYTVTGKRQKIIHQIGNSVPPQFARVLAIAVMEQIFGKTSPYSPGYVHKAQTFGFRQRKRSRTDEYRAIAAENIGLAGPKASKTLAHFRCPFVVTDSLDFSRGEDGLFNLTSFAEDDTWNVIVARRASMAGSTGLNIILRPVSDWIIPAARIRLRHTSSDQAAYLSMWKALDFLLSHYGFKADLVQLFGYYQYPSGVFCTECEVELTDVEPEMSAFLRGILSGYMVAKPYTVDEFASGLGVSIPAVERTLVSLKKIGYEVRSSNTNQALESGLFMVPYIFPTLTSQSVQSNKGL